MIGIITGGSIASLTATLSEMTDLGSFVVIRDGARKFWGTITELSHPQVPVELASMPINTSRFQPEAAINLKRMSSGNDGPQPVKQLPSLGSEVHQAGQRDIERLFGGGLLKWGTQPADQHGAIGSAASWYLRCYRNRKKLHSPCIASWIDPAWSRGEFDL